MAVDNVQVNSNTDVYGNSYTSAVSNDKLTNEDFLNLMIQELKMQDPTKPMDSAAMMDSQLQMSTIESNLAMSESMEALRASYATSALSSAANMIGKIADMSSEYENDDGEIETVVKEYQIESVIKEDGILYGNVREVVGVKDNILFEGQYVDYSQSGTIYDGGVATNIRFDMTEDGRVVMDGYKPVVLDENGDVIQDEEYLSKFANAGWEFLYGDAVSLPLENITKIR